MKQYIKRRLEKYPRLYASASSLYKLCKPAVCPSPYVGLTFLKPIEVQVVDKSYGAFTGGFSVIIPVKNEAACLPEYLDNLARQTAVPNEIVIIDSESHDGTPEIIEASRQKFACPLLLLHARDYFSRFNVSRTTLAQDRNIAVRACKSEIVLMTDAGCILPPNYFADLAGPMLENSDLDMAGAIYHVAEGSENSDHVPDWEKNDWKSFLPSCRGLVVRRKLFEQCGGLPEFLSFAGEDTLFDINYRRASSGWLFNRQAVTYWHSHKSDAEAWRKYYNWGVGDGESGVGDYSLYPAFCLQGDDFTDFLRIFGRQRESFCLGYLEGRTRRGKIDRERRHVKETVLLALERPLYISPTSRNLIKALVDDNKRVVAVSCVPSTPPAEHEPVFLDFDISLLELHYAQYFTPARFWSCYGNIDGPSRIVVAEDERNSGHGSRRLARTMRNWLSMQSGSKQ